MFQSFLEEEKQQQAGNMTSSNNSNSNSNDNDTGSDNDPVLPVHVQRQFFAYSYHFQLVGMQLLTNRVKHHVNTYFASMPLKTKQFTTSELCQCIALVCRDLEQEFEQEAKHTTSTSTTKNINLCSILLPQENQPDHPPILHEMLNELRDLLESEQFVHVLHETSAQAFNVLFKHCDKIVAYGHRKHASRESDTSNDNNNQQQQQQDNKDENNNQQDQQQDSPAKPFNNSNTVTSTCLGNIISRVMSEAKSVLHNGQENEYIKAIQESPALNNFCGMVYSLGIDL